MSMMDLTTENSISKAKIYKILGAILLIAVFIFFGYTVIHQRTENARLKNEKVEISQKLEEQQKKNDELQAVLDSEDKDSFIEQKARDEGYAFPDEQAFYDISSEE